MDYAWKMFDCFMPKFPECDEQLTFVEPKEEDGFNFPYMLWIPKEFSVKDGKITLLITPNDKVEESSDSQEAILEQYKTNVKYQIQEMRNVAVELGVPILIPIFPQMKA